MTNVSDTSCRENQNTHFRSNNIFFYFENHPVHEIMWTNTGRVGQATDDSMKHAHCMMDIKGYNYVLRTSNTCCLPTTTVVTRTLLNIMPYVHRCLVLTLLSPVWFNPLPLELDI